MKLLDFLLQIKRFPSIELWQDKDCKYHVRCSPSFETCEGMGYNLDDAMIDLIEKLEGYFTKEEKAIVLLLLLDIQDSHEMRKK